MTEVVASTIVNLSYVAAFAYAWSQWIKYLTARLAHVGAEPVPGIPLGGNMKKGDGRE